MPNESLDEETGQIINTQGEASPDLPDNKVGDASPDSGMEKPLEPNLFSTRDAGVDADVSSNNIDPDTALNPEIFGTKKHLDPRKQLTQLRIKQRARGLKPVSTAVISPTDARVVTNLALEHVKSFEKLEETQRVKTGYFKSRSKLSSDLFNQSRVRFMAAGNRARLWTRAVSGRLDDRKELVTGASSSRPLYNLSNPDTAKY